MKPKIFFILGMAMFSFMIGFLFFAINHPELDFPISYETTWIIYKSYFAVMVALFLTSAVLKIVKVFKKR